VNSPLATPPTSLSATLNGKGRTGEAYLTRSELAKLLGVSYTQARRLELTGAIAKRKTGKKKESLFLESEARELLHKKELRQASRLGPASEPIAGSVAARAFVAFDRGKSQADVVIDEQLSPTIVRALFLEWSDMRGIFLLTRAQVHEIEKLGLDGSYPIEDGAHFVRNLREVAEQMDVCVGCKKAPRRICLACSDYRCGEIIRENSKG